MGLNMMSGDQFAEDPEAALGNSSAEPQNSSASSARSSRQQHQPPPPQPSAPEPELSEEEQVGPGPLDDLVSGVTCVAAQ